MKSRYELCELPISGIRKRNESIIRLRFMFHKKKKSHQKKKFEAQVMIFLPRKRFLMKTNIEEEDHWIRLTKIGKYLENRRQGIGLLALEVYEKN